MFVRVGRLLDSRIFRRVWFPSGMLYRLIGGRSIEHTFITRIPIHMLHLGCGHHGDDLPPPLS